MALNWHARHRSNLTVGQRIADRTARTLGSWPFIIAQTVAVGGWIVLNVVAVVRHWDPYPFILLNLMFSVQAAYAAPVIMMSQNRQAERDRYQAENDYRVNVEAEKQITQLQDDVRRCLQLLEEMGNGQPRASGPAELGGLPL